MKPTIYFDAVPEDDDAFAQNVRRSIAVIHDLGIEQGDVIAFMLHNEPIVLELTLAARQLGIHWCVINWNFKAAEVQHVLKDSGAKLLIIHGNLAEEVKEGIPDTVRVLVVAPRERTRTAFALDESNPTTVPTFECW